MQQMIIANRLNDGVVVFFATGERWVGDIDAGLVIEAGADDALEIAKRHELECRVIDPSLIEVSVEDGRLKPVAVREAIRAFGPTVRTDLNGAGSASPVRR
jgi:sulfite reductase (NADPH) hemoprotein beta-component